MNNQTHTPPNRNRTYVITFVVLGILTLIEFGAATLPAFKLPVLIVLATTKAILVAGVYMHLRYDKKIFMQLLLGGLLFGLIMIGLFTVVLNILWPI